MINKNKLEELVKLIYIKELLGLNLFESIEEYPSLNAECNELIGIATTYEDMVLTKKNTADIKQILTDKIISIHTIALTIPDYRFSRIFFDDNGELTNLI